VEKVAKGVHRIRHGTPLEEMGGTKLDKPDGAKFLSYFKNELKEQLGFRDPKQR
jgi:hypothetical protein